MVIFKELTVFTSNYNHSHFIERKLKQITNQVCRPKEYLIIDDSSNDNSWEIIEKFSNRYDWIKSHRNNKNMGVVYNANRALELTNTELFYPTSSDDVIKEDAFQLVNKYHQKNKAKGVILGNMQIIDEEDNIVSIIKPRGLPETTEIMPEKYFSDYLKLQTPQFSLGTATYYYTNALKEVGGFQKEVGPYCDTIACNLIGLQFGGNYINKTLASWRLLNESYSQSVMSNLESVIEMVSNTVCIYNKRRTFESLDENYLRNWAEEYIKTTISSNLSKITWGKQIDYIAYCNKILQKKQYDFILTNDFILSR